MHNEHYAGSLLSVIRSLDENYLEIYLCTGKITGVVQTVAFDNRTIVVNGVTYDISPQYITNLKSKQEKAMIFT